MPEMPVSLSRPNASGFEPTPTLLSPSAPYIERLRQARGIIEFTAACPTPTCDRDIIWFANVSTPRPYPDRCDCENTAATTPNPLLTPHQLTGMNPSWANRPAA